MRVRVRSWVIAVVPLLLSACEDDPFDPCAEVGGCGVEGVDLAFAIAEIDWSADQRFDDRVGARLVQPGDPLVYRYHIINRGNQTSEPATVFVGSYHNESNLAVVAGPEFGDWIAVPALGPGESFEGTETQFAPRTKWLVSDEMRGRFELFQDGGAPYWDAVPGNGTVHVDYRVQLPYVSVDLVLSTDTLRLDDVRSFQVTVRNESALAAVPSGTPFTTCVLLAGSTQPGDGRCIWKAEEVLTLPTIAPGESVTLSGAVSFDDDYVVWPEPVVRSAVRGCAGRSCDEVELPVARSEN